MKQFKLPDLGEGVHEGQIIRVLVNAGDVVREDQPLMEVETDKAAVAIPSPFAGPVAEVHVKDGQMVHVGDVMLTFGAPTEAGSSASKGPATSLARASLSETTSTVAGRGGVASASTAKPQAAGVPPMRHKPASPFVRKLARTMGIDIETINGSGPGGRVQRGDLEFAGRGGTSATMTRSAPIDIVRPTHPPVPGGSLSGRGSSSPVAARVIHAPLPESAIAEIPAGRDESDAHGPIRRVALTQARKAIANVMTQSWTTIPHATDCDDADVTELEKLRKGYTDPDAGAAGRKITMLAFVVRAVVRALQRYPDFNAHFDADKGDVVYKRFINIAMGVHSDRGLVPMVIRDADRMTIPQLSDEINRLGEMARTASFSVNDTRGGTYTISNAGAMGGSRYSTPIITPGQAAVLAVGRTRWMPWVIEQENGNRGLAPRLIMPLSHSIDHRLLDGGHEIQFMQHVIADLQNPARLLL